LSRKTLLAQLNQPQQEAVTHGTGPLLVLAGAGSGKTRVLTFRIAYLLDQQAARPQEITAVTFTNKAAREMRDRVEQLIAGNGTEGGLRGGFVGTFHRWALQMLRRYPREIGLDPGFTILDSDDQRNLIIRAMRELGYDTKLFQPRLVLARISARTNSGETPPEAGAGQGRESELDDVASDVWCRYRQLKNEARAIDFDDMLVLSLQLLREHKGIRELVRRRARYLLVDEFQDTNPLQMDLLKLALGEERSITAVGDEDQSIYRWRGADMSNILSFEHHFPGARLVMLEENYRSTEPILTASGHLIACNAMRRGKKLFTSSRDGGEPVRLYVGEDERAEARWIAERMEELALDYPLDQMAVLIRTNAQSRPFEEELTRRQLAYRVVGGLRFWQRAEVKDALAYLRLTIRPDDLVAFQRVVNVPARGIGAVTLEALEEHAKATGLPVPQAARQLPESLTPRARQALGSFFSLLDEAREKLDQVAAVELTGWLLDASGLLSLYDGDSIEKSARRENLHQLTAAVAEAETQGQSLPELLDAVALLEEGDEEASPEVVSLMTLHSAKGLEFDVVFLAGNEEGLLPHAISVKDPDGVEEERRLAYVGMTRARRWLALTAVRRRFLFGEIRKTVPSRFLRELPPHTFKDVSDEPLTFYQPEPPPVAAVTSRQPAPELPVSRHAAKKPASKVPPTVIDANGEGWRPGYRVRHRFFGSGVVLSCKGRGPNLQLVIYFDRAGRKTIVPTMTKLERI
jgi:DNA helicase-2/ATP-dependent DNA helicase PcrA